MNDRLDRLLQVHQIKVNLSEKAYHALQQSQEVFLQNKARHAQLLNYRQDYLEQIEVLGQEGSEIRRMRNRVDFINHLDTALMQLNIHLAQLAKARTKAEIAFKEAKREEEAVSKLIEKVKNDQALILGRTQQKESDEYAQRQWYKNSYDQ